MSGLWSLLISFYITKLISPHLYEHYTVTVAIFSKLQYTCVLFGLCGLFCLSLQKYPMPFLYYLLSLSNHCGRILPDSN